MRRSWPGSVRPFNTPLPLHSSLISSSQLVRSVRSLSFPITLPATSSNRRPLNGMDSFKYESCQRLTFPLQTIAWTLFYFFQSVTPTLTRFSCFTPVPWHLIFVLLAFHRFSFFFSLPVTLLSCMHKKALLLCE